MKKIELANTNELKRILRCLYEDKEVKTKTQIKRIANVRRYAIDNALLFLKYTNLIIEIREDGVSRYGCGEPFKTELFAKKGVDVE